MLKETLISKLDSSEVSIDGVFDRFSATEIMNLIRLSKKLGVSITVVDSISNEVEGKDNGEVSNM